MKKFRIKTKFFDLVSKIIIVDEENKQDTIALFENIRIPLKTKVILKGKK